MARNGNNLCGYDVPFSKDIQYDIENIRLNGYSFMCFPLFHPRYRRDYSGRVLPKRTLPDTRSDAVIQERGDYSRFLVGRLSAWPCVESNVPEERRNAEAALLAELHYAAHLSLPAVLLRLRGPVCANLARVLATFLKEERYPFYVWVQLPAWSGGLGSGDEEASAEEASMTEEAWQEEAADSPWHWWTSLTSLASSVSSHLAVALELEENLPPAWVMRRWRAELVRALVLPTRLFVTNRRGFPVLGRAHQNAVKEFFPLNTQIIVSGNQRHHDKTLAAYHQYVLHMYANREPLSVYASHGRDFADTLQDPLQPLADNLQSGTYAVFEMDPYKYKAYQAAIRQALQDRLDQGIGGSTVDGAQVVMVLGAGRGPLVAAALAAGAELGLQCATALPDSAAACPENGIDSPASVSPSRKLRVYAVEKNINAVVTLRNRVLDEWGSQVTVLSGDMRQVTLAEQADIFVSELLGSFGDNELSPECLDGAMRFLRRDGISIPCEYTSYLAPVQCAKVYNEICAHRDPNKPHYVGFETPYVVNLVAALSLAEAQPLFTFKHPNWAPVPDNSRYGRLSFDVAHDATLHGFVGYFDSQLYGDVRMSIVPASHSPDMFSWFPLVFPLIAPVRITAASDGRRRVAVSMWRLCKPAAVWYEWALEEPCHQALHNAAGRSYTIGLS